MELPFMLFTHSPIEKQQFNNQTFYIKRDDLLSKDFSGNKARKFHYYLAHEFPNITKVVSYGSAQSNAMYSLSVLAKKRGWKFDYYVTHIANYLKENPDGNFKYAVDNGMRLIVNELKPLKEEIESREILFIEEGGRQEEAEYGIVFLAKEIALWKEEQDIDELNIFLPSGTGTTALYLQKNSKSRVYTVPCVGGVDYLKEQFFMLDENKAFHPTVIAPSKKRHFGKLYRESYNIWLELQEKMGIEFDLLYDPHGWLTLLENPQIFDKPLLYIHQGGLIGNESMLERYKRKYSENI
jgi:1-aminocyclopropane-1-carboxylate deaminase/D-cysteine desulfhydrase-like pyridoxal-dependent ACC family enzyme